MHSANLKFKNPIKDIAAMAKRGITYIKGEEPNFLKKFKQQVNVQVSFPEGKALRRLFIYRMDNVWRE